MCIKCKFMKDYYKFRYHHTYCKECHKIYEDRARITQEEAPLGRNISTRFRVGYKIQRKVATLLMASNV